MRYADAVGLWCALGYAALAVLARQPGEPDLPAFFLLVAWTGLPVFGLYLYFHRRGDPFPVGRLILWAVVFRICGLAGGPFYEDDFYRYLWDAYRFATTGTPYGVAPEEFFVDPGVPESFQRVLDGINYPELPTIYGPTTQLVFLLGYVVQPASVHRPAGDPDRGRPVHRGAAAASDVIRQRPALRLVSTGSEGDRVHRTSGRRGGLSPAGRHRAGARSSLAERRRLPGSGRGSQDVRAGARAAGAGPRPRQVLDPVRRHAGGALRPVHGCAAEPTSPRCRSSPGNGSSTRPCSGCLPRWRPGSSPRLALGLLFAAFWAYYNFVYARRGAAFRSTGGLDLWRTARGPRR